MKITSYEALCNLGIGIEEIYKKAIEGNNKCFTLSDDFIKTSQVRVGRIMCDLPIIKNNDYNTRCNRLILKTLELLQDKIDKLSEKYEKSRIGVIAATTNSGVEEFENSNNEKHFELGSPAKFVKEILGLKGYYSTVPTACSSGIKAFSLSRDLIRNGIIDAAIIVCVDPLSKVSLYGFNSLEVLSQEPSIPFSKNRSGMNIGEACAIFIAEKEGEGIKVSGIGESSDTYHMTTPDPEGTEAINAIKQALTEANLKPADIDYINAHGTGTIANDIMESNAIYKVFNDNVPVSSTKQLTGHCLGAASGIEIALCCKLIENFNGKLYPNIYDDVFDDNLPPVQLVNKGKTYTSCKTVMCNSFGFGGTNAIIILEK